MRKTLVVGGVESFVDRSLRPTLAAHGLAIEDQWAMEDVRRGGRRIPKGIEAVVAFVEMIPHAENVLRAVKTEAAERGIAYVATSRKKSFMEKDLVRAGFDLIHPVAASAVGGDLARIEEGNVTNPAPTKLQVPPPGRSETFEEAMSKLKAAVRNLRANHHVEEITVDKAGGVYVSIIKTVATTLED